MSRHAESDDVRPSRTRRLTVIAAAVVVTAVAAVSVVAWQEHSSGASPAADRTASVATALVTKTDLSTGQTMNGQLQYGKSMALKGTKDGVITWLPTPGSKVSRGQPLYRVDNHPVPVFYGGTPLYRTLRARGTTGPDVKVIADNLVALGYDIGTQPAPGTWVTMHADTSNSSDTSGSSGSSGSSSDAGGASAGGAKSTASSGASSGSGADASAAPATTVAPARSSEVQVKAGDGVLTQSLIAAIGRWQSHVGMDPTGVLGIGDVMVLSGEVRVGAVQAQIADSAAEPLMTVTSTGKVVTVSVDASDVGSMSVGQHVTVTLPDNSTVPGSVQVVGTTAQQNSAGDGDSDSGAPAQLTVSISLQDTAAVRRLTAAPVQVTFSAQTVKGVLTVPVGALLALSGGGYAVQLPDGKLIAVRTGMFAKGLVQISGDGVTAGTRVVTTS